MNVQSCVGYRGCFGTRVVVLCKSLDVEIVQDAGGVFNTGRQKNGGVNRILILEFLRLNSYSVFCWVMNT